MWSVYLTLKGRDSYEAIAQIPFPPTASVINVTIAESGNKAQLYKLTVTQQ